MLALRQLIPPLKLRTPAGRIVEAWDYKQKKNLLIVFLHGECEPCTGFLAQLAAQDAVLREQNAVALVTFLGAPPAALAEDVPAEIVIGTDRSGNAANQFLGEHAAFSSSGAPAGVFAADRYGELYAQWSVRIAHKFPEVAEVLSCLSHIELAC